MTNQFSVSVLEKKKEKEKKYIYIYLYHNSMQHSICDSLILLIMDISKAPTLQLKALNNASLNEHTWCTLRKRPFSIWQTWVTASILKQDPNMQNVKKTVYLIWQYTACLFLKWKNSETTVKWLKRKSGLFICFWLSCVWNNVGITMTCIETGVM